MTAGAGGGTATIRNPWDSSDTREVPVGVDLPQLEAIIRNDLGDVTVRWKHGEIVLHTSKTFPRHLTIQTSGLDASHRRSPKRWGQQMYVAAADIAKALGYVGIRSGALGRNDASDAVWKRLAKAHSCRYRKEDGKVERAIFRRQTYDLLERQLQEFNPYHDTKGRFTHAQGGAGITVGSKPYASPGERDAADGRVFRATPEAFQAALRKNTRLATLSEYDAATLATFKLFLLKGGQAGYALKPDGEFVNLFNSGGSATKGAGAWLVIHAIEQGASHGDHFDGFLTGFYRNLGWKETRREPNWTPGGPAVVYMRFTGDARERQSARARYRQHRRLDVA